MHFISLIAFYFTTTITAAGAYPITGDDVNCRSGPGTSYASVKTYKKGQDVKISCQTPGTEIFGNSIWDKTSDNCYVSDYYVKTGSSGYVTTKCGSSGGGGSTGGKAIIAAAETQKGLPYVWGGGGCRGPSGGGFDCSGLTQYAICKALKITIPRVAQDQYDSGMGKRYPRSQAKPGDLLFWGTGGDCKTKVVHVGIFIKDGLMINAARTGTPVREQAIWTSYGGEKICPEVMSERKRTPVPGFPISSGLSPHADWITSPEPGSEVLKSGISEPGQLPKPHGTEIKCDLIMKTSMASQTEADEAKDPEPPREVQYSQFTVNTKRYVVAMGSLASFFSPLSSSIYLPALTTIADDLHVSISRVNLTVTTYLIMQGVAPMFTAGFSDSAGRRPAYILCFTVYLAANLGLGLQNSYAAILVLRCLQSAGSSGTVALANGLVGDTITSAERGSYVAFASIGSMLGPSLSPIIGGLISQYTDWHWIFWFLLILGGVFFLFLVLFLPETCRKVVGDGSIPPPPLNNSVVDVIRHRRRKAQGLIPNPEEEAEVRRNYSLRFPSPMPTFKILLDFETSAILLTTGLLFAGFYAVMTGASTSFHTIYKFNSLQAALMYLPIGAGGVMSAFTTGRLVDWNYRRHARRAGLPVVKNVRPDISNFNIERARLEVALPYYYISNIAMVAYGWVMGRKVHISAPVILLFITGWALIGTSQVLNVLMVDLWPGKSATATAANNLFRCELGAAASAAISPMASAMGQGWAYTTLALISIAVSPFLWVVAVKGIKWRQKRNRKEEEKASSAKA
ncbi:unnamed protein product [Penicillium olsonii]|uniref:Major facilitator superfamily (MFS) profile domain-containing protein n=1 Tax=Penicillium olsonii TaxID=99116 RepID=A0A9W4HEK0_PENOL|nr:unnamed protein product [Penicillium olsonii]CAG8061320.1 unnamed protein product [Penicillium olsonii]